MIVVMKLTIAGVFTGFVLLVASSTAWAQGGQGPRGPQGEAGPGQPGPRPGPPDGQPNIPGNPPGNPRPGGPGQLLNDPRMAERLGITADQRSRIEAATQEHRLRRIDLNAAREKAQVLLEPLVKAEPPNEAQIMAQMDRVAQAQAELQKDEMRLQLEIRRILTPEQWRRMQMEMQQAGRGPAGLPQGPSPQR